MAGTTISELVEWGLVNVRKTRLDGGSLIHELL